MLEQTIHDMEKLDEKSLRALENVLGELENLTPKKRKKSKEVKYSNSPQHIPSPPTGRPKLPYWLKGNVQGSLASLHKAVPSQYAPIKSGMPLTGKK